MGRRLAPATVRVRTTLAACVVVAAALAVGAFLVVAVLRRSMVSNVDTAARTRARDVASLIAQGNLPTTLAVPGEEDALVQVVDRTGRVVAASGNLTGQEPIAGFRPTSGNAEARTFRDLPIGDNEEFRVVALDAGPSSARVTVYVATSLEQVERTVGTVQTILLAGLPVLLALVGATSWLIVGRALHPVDAIRAQVAEISEKDLTRRVPQPAADDEIGRLARTMNQMLDRLQAFADRQRRFVADASHELQSPLAVSRADLEVGLAHPGGTDWRATASELLADNDRMSRLVQDLLFLARADDPAGAVAHTLVDLDEIVRAEVGRARARSPVSIDASRVRPSEVRGNPDQLARVVRNLLDNASRYARTQITVELGHDTSGATLAVADDGPGIPAAARERIFERFTRLDDSRSRATGGAGLGLAIVRDIVHAHRGTVEVDGDAPGARFTVHLPPPG